VISLAVLLILRAGMYFRTEWGIPLSWWLILIVLIATQLLIMLLLPIISRIPQAPLQIPTLKHGWIESLIASPFVIAIALAIVTLESAVSHFVPGNSIVPEPISRMAESSNHVAVYLFMLVTFTLAPVAEEVFFRGFLQNAFRVRMPWLLATIVQSLIFGFGHSFGLVHAVGACFMGMILTLLYEWRQTLVTPIMVHAGVNFLCAIALALAMSTFTGTPILGVSATTEQPCIVTEVAPNSAAAAAGIHRGDIVVTFDGQRIRDFPQLVETVRRYQPGDRISISIERAGSKLDLEVVLGRRGE